ncbi:MAG: hypothetical protein WDO69_32720 [Pseudomonadota bacterium]
MRSFSAYSVTTFATLLTLTSAGVARAQSEPTQPATDSQSTPTDVQPGAASNGNDEHAPAPATSPDSATSFSSTAPPVTPPPSPPGTSASDDASVPAPPILKFGSNLRLSVGIPGGDLAKDSPLSDVAKLLYQLEGSLDAVVLGRAVIGFRSGIGIASLGNDFSNGCSADGASCMLADLSLGIHGEFLILPPSAKVSPWVGLAYSREWLLMSESNGAASAGANFSGSVLDFSVGADLRFGGKLAGGPFITYRTGEYTSVDVDADGQVPLSASVIHPSRHDWLMLGLRMRY